MSAKSATKALCKAEAAQAGGAEERGVDMLQRQPAQTTL